MTKEEIFAALAAKEREFIGSIAHPKGDRITRASLRNNTCVYISDQAIVFQNSEGKRNIITLGLMGRKYPSSEYVFESLYRDLHDHYIDLCNFSKEDLQLARDTENEYFEFRNSEKEKENRRKQYEQLKQEFEASQM